MATMYPDTPDSDTPRSEKEVFELLKSTTPKSWTILHARRFVLPRRRGRPVEGEVDFLVLVPDRGLLGLEIKGGKEVGRDANGWYSISHQGHRNKIKDPGAQAQNAVHAIHSMLGEESRIGDSIPFGWGVVFPGASVRKTPDPALPIGRITDIQGLATLKESILRTFDANGLPEQQLAPGAQKVFLKVLAPIVRLAPSLSDRISQDERELVRLTEGQAEILDFLEEQRRVGVEGAAGTGKTLVAMEKARRLAAAGAKVLFLCFNRPLADHLAHRETAFTIRTFHQFASAFCKKASIPFSPPNDSKKAQEFWDQTAPELLMDALDMYPDERYDAVVIDEGQDFKEFWWLAVEKLLEGDDSVLYVFFDPNQDLFGGGPIDTLGLSKAKLKYNCRNTRRIANYSSAIISATPTLRDATPDGADVIDKQCAGDAEMIDSVRKLLHQFVVEEGIPGERVVILTTRARKASALAKAGKLGNFELIALDEKPSNTEIRFASLQRFKGLEADAVIVCDVDDRSSGSSAAHLYVGTSRARHVLAVLRYA